MCRFVAYKGVEALMADLLIKSENSLMIQSYDAKKRYKSLNGDGFGIAWYPTHDDPIPGVFTSVLPAWGDRNLVRMSDKIYSGCFFAHVRDATPGLPVTEFNCHPFRYNQIIFMHNGLIADFAKMKRRLRETLSDEFYNIVEGTTDSEHLFALILNALENKTTPTPEDFFKAIEKAFRQIAQWNRELNTQETTFLNIALTDGKQLVATRYASSTKVQPASLFVSSGVYQLHEKDHVRVYGTKHPKKETVIIASEPLTQWHEDWKKVERNQAIIVDDRNHLSIKALDV